MSSKDAMWEEVRMAREEKGSPQLSAGWRNKDCGWGSYSFRRLEKNKHYRRQWDQKGTKFIRKLHLREHDLREVKEARVSPFESNIKIPGYLNLKEAAVWKPVGGGSISISLLAKRSNSHCPNVSTDCSQAILPLNLYNKTWDHHPSRRMLLGLPRDLRYFITHARQPECSV